MKGKERSPAKAKRSRGAEESTRERSGKKLSSGGGSNGSSGKTSESSTGRRSLHVEKAISSSRDYDQSSRAQGLHRYGSPGASSGSSSSKGGAESRAAKHARGRLVLYDRPLKIEAVYLNVGGTNRRRSRSPGEKDSYGGLAAAVSTLATHRHPHGQRALSPGGLGYRDYRLQQLALGRLPPAPAALPRELDREREYSLYDSRLRSTYTVDPRLNFRDEDLALEIDARANRTLFVGNLDVVVKESEIYRVFGRFGTITEVDIKRAGRGQQTTYGFIKFENLDMAHRAKVAMSGKMLRSHALKIGYGKVVPTNRLWVGGLGPWVPVTALAREFDRFGTIRQIDYRKGENWAYIQYESLDAAQAACTQMRGFPMGGDHRRLRVDFAEADVRFPHPYVQPLPIPYIDFGEETPGHRTSEASRARDRSPPLIFRDRERDAYTNNDWVSPPARDRHRVTSESLETIERRADNWALDRDRERDEVNRDQPRKRRLDDSRHLDRSPESDRSRKRHCVTPERSPEGSGGRDNRYNDSDRVACRSSPSRDWKGSLERGQEDKHDRKNSVERERRHRVPANKSPLKKDEHPEGNSKVKPPQKSEAAHKLCLAWQGMLLLKNSNFPSNMHLLQGDLGVASSLLVEGPSGGKVAQLKITQRLRLDQPKLDEVTRRIRVAGPNGYAILLAIPGTSEGSSVDQASSTQRPLRNLVSYLKQKQAAGVISLPVGSNKDKDHAGVLHAFPPCNFSQQFLDAEAKALVKSDDDYLIMIIVRGAS
uniref:RNA-binding motif protein 15 n=1 Tax=Xenopus tropicalis TaxID=8364 RepID=A0A803JFV9_XENTR